MAKPRVVNDTFEKYRQYRYRYRLKKVSSIPISILNLKSIADTDTDTFVYDFSTTGDIRRRISGNTAVRYTAVTGTYSYTTVKKPLALPVNLWNYCHGKRSIKPQARIYAVYS